MDEVEILRRYRRIAVVGLSTNPAKEAHTVPAFMRDHGYTIIPVNPRASEVLGETAYPSLSAIPEAYDIVCLFRPSDQVGPFVDEAIREGKAKAIWMQLGIRDEAAAERARAAGLEVVMDSCMRTVHNLYFR